MLKVDFIGVTGFEPAVHGMRNPKNSWKLSDSGYDVGNWCDGEFYVGNSDLDLMRRLSKAGSEHRKFDRMINIYVDITAPLYWWKEFDTYKVGTVANSCSTMHKLASRDLRPDDFSMDHLEDDNVKIMGQIIDLINVYRRKFVETKDKTFWWQMIQMLPSSYNQRRTVMMNYEVAHRIVEQRTGHKLDEWKILIDFLHELPYFDSIFEEKR